MRQAVASIVLLFVAVTGAQAAPVLVDFEEFALGDSAGGIGNLPPLVSQGFEFTGSLGFSGAEIVTGSSSGSNAFGGSVSGLGQDGNNFSASVEISQVGGGPFAVNSLDLVLVADPNGFTRVSGTLAGGGIADLSAPVGTGDWLNLASVSFLAEGNGFGFGSATVEIDNISLTAVPVPAAVWLFASALGGLVGARRFVPS